MKLVWSQVQDHFHCSTKTHVPTLSVQSEGRVDLGWESLRVILRDEEASGRFAGMLVVPKSNRTVTICVGPDKHKLTQIENATEPVVGHTLGKLERLIVLQTRFKFRLLAKQAIHVIWFDLSKVLQRKQENDHVKPVTCASRLLSITK